MARTTYETLKVIFLTAAPAVPAAPTVSEITAGTDLSAENPPDTAVEKDDDVTITGSPDDDLVGRTFRVTDVPRDEWQIVRVALCEEVT